MYSRRDLLRTAGAGLALGAGLGASASSATAAGASFGDGVNIQAGYYCDGQQDLGWSLMNQYPDIQSVRVEIEPPSWGEADPGVDIQTCKRWLDEAYENGYHVVATCHHHPYNGSTDPANVQEAADWWAQHYDTLSADAEFTINLLNEWGDHDVTVQQYVDAYEPAIATIREQTDYEGPIVIDAPGWGQNHHVLADAAEQLSEDDLILSAHVYGDGYNGTAGESIRPGHLDVMDETDYPCMIGEFGANRPGDADWSAIVEYATELGWPVFGWAWNGDGEDDPMNMVEPMWIDQPCPSSYSESDYFDVIYDRLGGGATQQPPDAPAGVALVDLSGGEVTLEWEPVDGADEYVVYHSDTAVDTVTATEATVNLLDVVDDGQVDHADVANLGVAAANDAGESSIAGIVVEAPAAPTGLSVVSESPSEATVGWDAVENADSYNVYAGDALLHSTEETETTIAEFPSEDTYVSVGIEAVNAAGESSIEEILVRRCVDEPTLDDPGRDVDCDGAIGQSDVAEFFRYQHREAWNRRPDLFDYSGNGDVTHGDVVELFDYVALN